MYAMKNATKSSVLRELLTRKHSNYRGTVIEDLTLRGGAR
jgi:hypothetical protein